MKSIKEKAEEYSLEPRANAHCGYDEEDLGNSFVAGANYVLDVVEEFMKHNLVHSSNMKRLIEQLKK